MADAIEMLFKLAFTGWVFYQFLLAAFLFGAGLHPWQQYRKKDSP